MQYEAREGKTKAPSKTESVFLLIMLRTALGSFSVLTDPAPLARLKVGYRFLYISQGSPGLITLFSDEELCLHTSKFPFCHSTY
jgi:hypothetical protein